MGPRVFHTPRFPHPVPRDPVPRTPAPRFPPSRMKPLKTAANINRCSLRVSAWHVSEPDNVNCVQNCTWLYLIYSVSKSFFCGKTGPHLGFESYNRWWCNALGKTRKNESMQNLLCGYSDRQTTFICVWLKLKLNSFRGRATHKIFWWRLSWTVHPSDRSWKQYSELSLEATCGSWHDVYIFLNFCRWNELTL